MDIAEQILQFFNKDKSIENTKQVEHSKQAEPTQLEQVQVEPMLSEQLISEPVLSMEGKKTAKSKRQNFNVKSGNKNGNIGGAKNANGKNRLKNSCNP